jgi:hypothetical protein
VLPACNTEAMQLHLNEIATKITPGAHAILLLDQAGWHGAKALKVPSNISLLQLPPRAPELNGERPLDTSRVGHDGFPAAPWQVPGPSVGWLLGRAAGTDFRNTGGCVPRNNDEQNARDITEDKKSEEKLAAAKIAPTSQVFWISAHLDIHRRAPRWNRIDPPPSANNL